MPRRIEWGSIKLSYTQGIMTDGQLSYPILEDLAQKFGVSHSTLRKRSAAEDWTNARNLFKTHLEAKRREKRTEFLAGKAADFDADVFKVAAVGIRHIQGHFLAAEKRFVSSGATEPMGTSQLNQLSVALDRYQKVGRLALGEPTEIEGDTDDAEQKQLIRTLINNPTVAEQIAENFRQKIRSGSGEE